MWSVWSRFFHWFSVLSISFPNTWRQFLAYQLFSALFSVSFNLSLCLYPRFRVRGGSDYVYLAEECVNNWIKYISKNLINFVSSTCVKNLLKNKSYSVFSCKKIFITERKWASLIFITWKKSSCILCISFHCTINGNGKNNTWMCRYTQEISIHSQN